MDAVNLLADVLDAADQHLQFTVFEVGARAVHQAEEPFYRLLSMFPGSRIIAFEPDDELCAQKNATGREGLVHYPFALGRCEEQRPFYETEHPMCSSLYQPNESLVEKYNNLEVMRIRRIGKVDTVSIDHFVEREGIECIDFIKIDIQGAELEVFQGGVNSLTNVLAVVTEAEFIQLYVDQPLFGDVSSFLASQNLQFQKFLGVAGRTLAPIVLNNNPNEASQQMWADVLFLRQLFCSPPLSTESYLKLAVLALLYDCIDVALYCVQQVDERAGLGLAQIFLERLNQMGA